MTDYAAEQAMELEALAAILMDQFCGELDGPRPAGWPADLPAYRVIVTPSSDEDAGEAASTHDKQLDIVFAYPPTYPDAPPLLKPRSVRGLSDAELADVGAVMAEQVEANGGMAMLYAVIAAAQDWLRDKLAADGGGGGDAAASAASATKSAEALAEEEEARAAAARALGTAVTRDTFMQWRAAFDAERAAAGLTIVTGPGTPGDGDRPTGRQWFAALEARGGNAAETDDEGEWDPAEADADAAAAAALDGGSDDDESDDDFLDELEEELAAKE